MQEWQDQHGQAGAGLLIAGGGTRLDWSPDGSKIAFPAWGGTGLYSNIWVLDLAAGTVQNLTPIAGAVDDARSPAWSPDLDPDTAGYQGKLAFSGADWEGGGASRDILALDVTIATDGTLVTGELVNLTSSPALNEWHPAWSPDGQFIAYNTEESGVRLMRADGSAVQDVAVGSVPTSSPDGPFWAYLRSRPTKGSNSTLDIYRSRSDGAYETAIIRTDSRYERWPDWNPAWINDLGSAMHADSPGVGASGTLLDSQVRPLLAEAVARWQAAGADFSAPSGLDIRIANLGGTTLGKASGNTFWLDDDAAGWGWFVDPTPWDDYEFSTPGDQGEQHRIDLLTVLAHELGHVLGYDHQEGGVMQDSLEAGVRRMPEPLGAGTLQDASLMLGWWEVQERGWRRR